MRAVNLLPRERTGANRTSLVARVGREPLLPLAVVVLILAAAAVGLAAHSASSTVAQRKSTVQSLDAQLATVAANDAQKGATAAPSRTAALTKLTTQRTSWDGFLYGLSRVVPEDVWMLNLSASTSGSSATAAAPAPSSSTSTTPTGFTVTGYTYSQPAVARMMRRLELLPWLRDVSLVTSTKTAIAQHTVYQFTVGANFVGIPAVGT